MMNSIFLIGKTQINLYEQVTEILFYELFKKRQSQKFAYNSDMLIIKEINSLLILSLLN
jgi:hypothetical protein